ncbi:MAG: hypothetical protein LBB88_06520 [Planctomycetaceae bacterium]|nr:hypothetical protein [Planctomycetaceae bacterium]
MFFSVLTIETAYSCLATKQLVQRNSAIMLFILEIRRYIENSSYDSLRIVKVCIPIRQARQS